MMSLNGMRFLSFLLAAVLLAGCRGGGVPETAPARSVPDDLGKQVALPAKVTRAVSLAPNVTEIVFAVGAGDRLVGVTDFCDFPEEAKKIRKIGDTLKPNIEAIVALKPEVVLVSTASQLEAFTGTLAEQGIAVFVTNPNSLDGVFRSIERIGEVFGAESRAREVVGSLRERVAVGEKKARTQDRYSVFVQIDKTLYTVGKESYITELVAKAGGVSVTKETPTAYPKLSKETALALKPEVIILSDSPDNDAPSDAFADSPAVKNGRVYRINADILSRPGPRIVDAMEQIAKFLHQ